MKSSGSGQVAMMGNVGEWLQFVLPVFFVVLLNSWVRLFNYDRFFEELPKVYQSVAKIENRIGGTQDLLLVTCGLRPLASDMAMLDMLLYYGTREGGQDPHGRHEHRSYSLRGGSGVYLDLYVLTKRILVLDPFFRYAALYGSGALAFNEGREDEAIDILREAMRKDPTHWQYGLVLSSIAYKKATNYLKIVESLEPLIDSLDCPSMLKNILANYYVKIGQISKAIWLYEKILLTAPEKDYRQLARSRLERLRHRPLKGR